MTQHRRICLITGASAGIGAAIAREYAARGWDLALTARREAPMIELATELKNRFGTTSHIFALDLADANATQDLMQRLEKKALTIDGLVNNAGFGHPGNYLDSAWEDHERSLQVMLRAPCELAHALSIGMASRGFGRIINVASLAGHVPGSKGHTTYAAIKSFLIKFSQSLNAELKADGVHVSALCPGFTYSEFHDVNGTREATSRLPDYMWMSAEEVAENGVDACEANRAVHITGRINKAIAILARLLPESLAEKIMAANSNRIRQGH
jgi:short-subunit dehydrogenase